MAKSRSRTPTLKDIAQTVGLTAGGVSLALRGDPTIPRATCERVRRAARRLGYRPDPELARLMSYLRRHRVTRARSVLGLLSLHPKRFVWNSNSYLRRLRDGVAARASELGYDVEDVWLADPELTPARVSRILYTRGIKALVIVDGPLRIESLGFDLKNFSAVAVGYGIEVPIDRVCQHQYQEMFLVLKRLAELGYRRPGLVLTSETDLRTQRHYSSAFTIAAAARPKDRVPLLLSDEITPALFERWMHRHRPDVVVAQNASIAAPATLYLEWIRHLGLRVPEEVGFVSLDLDTAFAPACSGILQNYEQVAAAAVEMAVSNVRHSLRGIPETPRVILIEGRWSDGATTRTVT